MDPRESSRGASIHLQNQYLEAKKLNAPLRVRGSIPINTLDESPVSQVGH